MWSMPVPLNTTVLSMPYNRISRKRSRLMMAVISYGPHRIIGWLWIICWTICQLFDNDLVATNPVATETQWPPAPRAEAKSGHSFIRCEYWGKRCYGNGQNILGAWKRQWQYGERERLDNIPCPKAGFDKLPLVAMVTQTREKIGSDCMVNSYQSSHKRRKTVGYNGREHWRAE